MEKNLGPIDLHHLQVAFDKLSWMPPDSKVVAAHLRGDERPKGKALDIKPITRRRWVEEVLRAEHLDRVQQALVYTAVRTDIGEWLDHFSRGSDRPSD